MIETDDSSGFKNKIETTILSTWANIKTTKGFTLVINNSDFEKSYTNFTIRYPKVEVKRDMYIKYKNRIYRIDYLNNLDEAGIELEIQAIEVTK